MPQDTDYEEIVDGTIDEVKEAVEERDLDLEELLAAEQAHKDRVTLTDWLEDRIEASEAGDEEDAVEAQDERVEPEEHEEETEDVAPYTPYTGSSSTPIRSNWKAAFAVGAILGALAVAAVFSTSLAPITSGGTGPQDTVSTSTAGSELQTFINNNRQALRLPESAEITVKGVEKHAGTGMYRTTLQITTTVRNRSITQDVNVFMTRDAQYVFFNQPLDMTKPVQEQLQQRQSRTQPSAGTR